MRSTYNKISNTEQELLVELPVADFEKYFDRAAESLSENLEIQGFRKGHAPRNIVEQIVGSDKLYSEAAEAAVRGTFSEALKQAGVDTERTAYDAVPEIKITKLAPGNPLEYKVVLVTPFLELTNNFKQIAERTHAKEKEKFAERTKVEEKEVESTIEWLAKSKNKQNPPEVNNDFAKSLGNFKNIEELKKNVGEGIHMEKERKEKERLRILIVKEIGSESQCEVPGKVIDSEVLRIEEEFKNDVAQMGLDFDAYLSKINKRKEELREGWREQAKERVEVALVVEAVAKKEGIEPLDVEVQAESQKILNRYSSAKDAEKNINPQSLRNYVARVLRDEKTLVFLEGL